MPKPSALTPELTGRIVERVRHGVAFAVAAGAEGVSRSTFYYWLKKAEEENGDGPHSDFAAALERARDEWEANAQARLDTAVDRSGVDDAASIRWTLERRAQERYGKSIELKVRDDAARQILERLRGGLDAGTFARVLGILDPEGGEGVPDGGEGE